MSPQTHGRSKGGGEGTPNSFGIKIVKVCVRIIFWNGKSNARIMMNLFCLLLPFTSIYRLRCDAPQSFRAGSGHVGGVT